MVLIEALEASGSDPMHIGTEDVFIRDNIPTEGRVIEFPRFDPISLTRDEWLNLSDSRSKIDALVSLRKKDYNPEYLAKSQELFPEGYSVPLSEIEKRVFNSMMNIMSSEDEINPNDKQTLREHLHDISADDAIIELRQEARVRASSGNFWYTRNEIGGYELNRLIAKEIDDRVKIDQKRDEIKMHALTQMLLTLDNFGIPMLEQDQMELERLKEEFNERQDAIRAYWEAEREKGYQKLRTH
jgi:hypothetical protein